MSTYQGITIEAFQKLNLHPDILKAITKDYENTTAIQKRVIPLVMKGSDIIGASKSGTGKTASYVLPLLHKLQKVVKADNKVARLLIVVPTIELVDQVYRTIVEFSKYLDIRTVKIQGGTPKSVQLGRLSQGTDIIVATPGRLQDFIRDKKINLENVNSVVLDEADTMLELGFLEEIKAILKYCKQPRQTLLFSATISQNIKRLGKEFLREPAIVEVSHRRDVVNFIAHRAYKIDVKKREALVVKLLEELNMERVLLFASSKSSANKIYEYLKSQKIRVAIIHGDIKRSVRAKALSLLKSGQMQVLVATDIAARGIDIQELPWVLNYELPEGTDEFTHRVGRTGRANHKGSVVSLLTIHDYNKFSKIEKDLRLNIKRQIHNDFELEDRQPRQRQPMKKSLREKKGYIDYDKKRKFTYAAQKKKRDAAKADRDRRKGNEKKK